MSKQDIEKFKQDWVAAVKRALKVGFDVGIFLSQQLPVGVSNIPRQLKSMPLMAIF